MLAQQRELPVPPWCVGVGVPGRDVRLCTAGASRATVPHLVSPAGRDWGAVREDESLKPVCLGPSSRGWRF